MLFFFVGDRYNRDAPLSIRMRFMEESMRYSCLAVALLLSLSGSARAQPEVDRIIDRAIQAHGGAANLARLKARHSKTRGRVFRETPIPFTQEIFAQAPNQIRENMQFQATASPGTVVTVLNGASARLEINGNNRPLDDGVLNELKESAYLAQLVRLISSKNKEHQRPLWGDHRLRPAGAGSEVLTKGHRTVTFISIRNMAYW